MTQDESDEQRWMSKGMIYGKKDERENGLEGGKDEKIREIG